MVHCVRKTFLPCACDTKHHQSNDETESLSQAETEANPASARPISASHLATASDYRSIQKKDKRVCLRVTFAVQTAGLLPAAKGSPGATVRQEAQRLRRKSSGEGL